MFVLSTGFLDAYYDEKRGLAYFLDGTWCVIWGGFIPQRIAYHVSSSRVWVLNVETNDF